MPNANAPTNTELAKIPEQKNISAYMKQTEAVGVSRTVSLEESVV